MDFETTIERPVEAAGVGLHSGVEVNIRILPAPGGAGIVFQRTDLENFRISALAKYVARVSYATSLMRQGVLISTTEHLLSALYSLGIDNALIEIDNLEVPIFDGSSRPIVELLEHAGRKTLRRRRRYLAVTEPVTVEDRGKRISILPHDSFHLSCHIYFEHPQVGRQSSVLEVTPDRYAAEIAPARTFGFAHELDQLRDMGLIRGATLENAVCFERDRVLNAAGLRFPDECCRHKALDLIGDLALIGYPLLGRVVAERAGHAMHVALVKKILGNPALYAIGTREELIRQPVRAMVS